MRDLNNDLLVLMTLVRRRARMPNNKPLPPQVLSDLIGRLRDPGSYPLVPVLLGLKAPSKTLRVKAAAVRLLALGPKA